MSVNPQRHFKQYDDFGTNDTADIVPFPGTPQPKAKPAQQRGEKRKPPQVGKMKHGVRAYMTKDGVRYLAQVRVKGFDMERGTYADFDEALTWQEGRAKELRNGPKQSDLGNQVPNDLMLDGPEGLLMKYIERANLKDETALPKDVQLKLKRLAGTSTWQEKGKYPRFKSLNVRVLDVGMVAMVKFCEERASLGVKPQTIATEISCISTALTMMSSWNVWADFNPMIGVHKKLLAAGLIAESDHRERRPEGGEFAAILNFFKAQEAKQREQLPARMAEREYRIKLGSRSANASMNYIVPMADIVSVEVLNAFRRGTIGRLLWSKLDVENSFINVMVKNSKGKKTKDNVRRSDHMTPLLAPVLEIILRQPRIDGEDRIFPYLPGLLSDRWEAARKHLAANGFPNIATLNQHDLRHQASTMIANTMKSDVRAMQITQHRTFRHFKRYVNFNKSDAKQMAQEASVISLPI